ncbi:hypothetical protein PBI_PEREGRIN_86 [Rhodococcus phage Peregrin]|nr:hypothetical protein PBI_PEREGRIN_86 [Rhodococcus phage Peregrin]
MYDKIDTGDLTLQVESTRENREATDAFGNSSIAISQGAFDRGLSQDGVSYTEMRMNKNGDVYNIYDFTDITGWVADAGYPGTVITGNGLVIQQSAQVVLEFKGAFGNGFFSSRVNSYVRILVNGNIVKTASGNANLGIYHVLFLNAGDVVKIQARCTNYWFDASRLRGGRDTYLKVRLNKPGEFDFESDLAWPENSGFNYVGNNKWVVAPRAKKGRNPITTATDGGPDSYGSSYEGYTVGPVIAQSKVPWPVKGGQTVNFSGQFVSKGAPREKSDFSGDTLVLFRFSLWGSGVTTDEYGTETNNKIELMYYQASNSTSGSASYNISGIPSATVPEGITQLYFTVSCVYQADGTYGTINYEVLAGSMVVSSASYFGASVVNPIQVIINQPSTIQPVYTHPLSKTGVAFKNPGGFLNAYAGAQLTFFGQPDAACTVQAYNYTPVGGTGTLIGTYSAAANERKTVSITPGTPGGTVQLITTSGTTYVEKFVNSESDTLTSTTDQLRKLTFLDIEEDVSRISVLKEEADKSTATIDFATATLDPAVSPLLKPGKIVRVLGRHYGNGNTVKPAGWSGPALYSTIFTGKVKRVNSGYSYEDDPVVQITLYDVTDSLQSINTEFASDQMVKYGAWFNSVGSSIIYNDIDWAGSAKEENALPNKFIYEPSAWGKMNLADSISMTRNAKRWWWMVDRFNKLRILTTLNPTTKYVLTDGTAAGDLNYGRFSRGSDTDSVINKVSVQEYILDVKDLKGRTLSSSTEPPADLDFVRSKQQTATFSNKTSVNAYGEFSKSFDVVRGNGNYLDLANGYTGSNFKSWSESILAERSEPTINISELNIPIKNSDDIRKISELEILDKVDIIYKGEHQISRVREIEHTIMPGRWYTEIRFNSKGDMTFWD